MKLTYAQIAALALGAETTVETELGLCLYRFNDEEMNCYTDRLGEKCFSSAGIRLAARTDATALTLNAQFASAASRSFMAVELFVNGKAHGVVKNYPDGATFEQIRSNCTMGPVNTTFSLPSGEKEIELYLPWTAMTTIIGLELTDATFAEPIPREKILMMYGDSITQGYDAYLPSHSYSNQLADALGMQVINKAIGGEVFYPELARCVPTSAPDLITVAYGTNDFDNRPCDDLEKACRAFYENLRKTYPDAPILALTPVWRKDWEKIKESYQGFHQVEQVIRYSVEDIPGVTVIHGWELIPQEEIYYGDLKLHPSDEGFRHYFENLWKATGWQ